MTHRLTVTILVIFTFVCCNRSKKHGLVSSLATNSLFEKIPEQSSKVFFENRITPKVESNTNLFDYDYFYNGAGVGIADLNNDELPDVFLCGNQVQNKLFINEGKLKFKDVSKPAGLGTNQWSNAVTFADINQDGWLDIYVSQGGPGSRESRQNLLYVNKQDGTFEEAAKELGLADDGISTQSAFFDYDQDGDLDCIVMNENEFYGANPIQLDRLLKNNPESLYYNSSHFYRNDNGKYVDITQEAGIQRPMFGLGLVITDINLDGFLDIYMTSDYYLPDALFINNGDGSFTDSIKEYTKQVSFFGMGADIADVDNDGLQDIFVLDMASSDHVRSKTLMASMNTDRFNYYVNKAKFQHQYMFNSLQKNLGNDKFTNVAQLTNLAKTDWSWSVLISDFDLDGNKDVHITNGYRKYGLNKDLQLEVFKAQRDHNNNIPLKKKKNLYESMPSEKLQNFMYRQYSDHGFKNLANEWGLKDSSFSNGAAIGDLDNDGDLDLIINNIDENAFLYKNTAIENNMGNFLVVHAMGHLSESFPQIWVYTNGNVQFSENKRVRGYRSAQQNIAHFGFPKDVGIIDSVIIKWPSGKLEKKLRVVVNKSIHAKEQDANYIAHRKPIKQGYFKPVNLMGVDFVHKENPYDDFEKEVLLPYKQSTIGPVITKGDINGDGRDDFFVGGASGQSGEIYIQSSNGFLKKTAIDIASDRQYEDMEATFFDFDGDDDLDLYVVSGGNEFSEFSSLYSDRIYINDGDGNFKRKPLDVLNSYPKNGKSVTAMDYDKDGDMDLIIGNRIVPQQYPKSVSSTLYENTNGNLKDVTGTIAKELLDFGIINKIIATDFNNDGWQDFIAVGEWTTIGFFMNDKGSFKNITPLQSFANETGWWFSISETDVNNDELKDYIVGNIGLNIKFKASKSKPFKIFADDFDDNGTNDIVLSNAYKGTYVPVRGRECSSQQMPFIKDKYKTYEAFAKASLADIYGEKLETSYLREATEFKSILLLNKGDNEFEKIELPIEAQYFPVLDCEFVDLNQDGFQDVVLAGNIYETEVETPRLDAVSGLVLLSNGKDGYYPMDYISSGLYLDGNVKSIEIIETSKGSILLSAVNNGPINAHNMLPAKN